MDCSHKYKNSQGVLLVEDDLRGKTTFDGRQSLVQDDLLEIGGLLAPPSLAGQLGRDGG